jgi:hypothetical protein
MGPIGRQKRPMGLVVLAQQEIGINPGTKRRIGMRLARLARPVRTRCDARAIGRQRVKTPQQALLEEGIESVVQLHQVAVGIVYQAPLNIGHRGLLEGKLAG